MGEHSVLSPSSAHRRVRCPGSLAACKGIPSTTSEYAAEGTAYHEVAAWALKAMLAGFSVRAGTSESGVLCGDYVGVKIDAEGFSFQVTEENAAYAQEYVDYVRRIPGTLLVEVRLDTSPVVGIDDQGGTGDAVVLDHENRTIHVVDLKFGRGEQVFAEGNEQLLEYAAAAWMQYDMLGDWQFVQVHIHQPRINHYDTHRYTIGELRGWIADIKPKEQLAYRLWESGTPEEIRANMIPGEKQCRWCPIKGSCAARNEYMLALYPVIPTKSIQMTMEDFEVAAALERIDELEDWCRAIRGEALARATAGRELPGWKIVVGRKGARQWGNETVAEIVLRDALDEQAYKPRVIITPTEAEKRLKNTHYALGAGGDGLEVVQADGKPSLARIEDKREALVVSAPEFGLTE